MPIQTSLFLPPNLFAANGSYTASLIGSNGNTSTLAIRCTAPELHTSPSCGTAAPISTITVAPTTVEMTTVSTEMHDVVTISETCTVAPAMSTAVCNVTADTGAFAPFDVDAALYAEYMASVNITNVAAHPPAPSNSSGMKSATAHTLFALLGVCTISAVILL